MRRAPQLTFTLLQGQALCAAPYHLDCPLCQDIQSLQAEMFRLGIKIPDRSAPTTTLSCPRIPPTEIQPGRKKKPPMSSTGSTTAIPSCARWEESTRRTWPECALTPKPWQPGASITSLQLARMLSSARHELCTEPFQDIQPEPPLTQLPPKKEATRCGLCQRTDHKPETHRESCRQDRRCIHENHLYHTSKLSQHGTNDEGFSGFLAPRHRAGAAAHCSARHT
ncbi:hypothetical protein CIB84_015243, partial [Bambusicola thoracicus]